MYVETFSIAIRPTARLSVQCRVVADLQLWSHTVQVSTPSLPSTARLSLTTLHPTLHILRECCTCTESGPKMSRDRTEATLDRRGPVPAQVCAIVASNMTEIEAGCMQLKQRPVVSHLTQSCQMIPNGTCIFSISQTQHLLCITRHALFLCEATACE